MSDFYKYKVIAKTGDTASNDTQKLTTIQKEVSINNKGQVAFVGNDFIESWLGYTIPKDSIFVSNIDNNSFTNISPNIAASTFLNNKYALTNPTRWFDFSGQGPTRNNAYFEITPGIQINDQGNVLARRIEWNFYGPGVLNNIVGVNPENGQPIGVPTVVPTGFTNKTYSFIEQWDGNQVNNVDAIVQGVGPTVWTTGSYPFFALPGGIWEGDFDLVYDRPSFNNDGDTVFRAANVGGGQVVRFWGDVTNSGNFSTTQYTGDAPISWVADNNTSVVYLNNSIDIRDASFNPITNIAGAGNGFSKVGTNPGISDDGNAVAFYGEILPTSPLASSLNPGQGIFTAINSKFGWQIQRVAGIVDNGYFDPGETGDTNNNGKLDVGETEVGLFASFNPDTPIAIQSDNSAFNVTYIANDTVNKSIYTTNLDTSPGEITSSDDFTFTHQLVVEEGSTIPGLDGTVKDFNIYDPLNSRGDVAFWVETDAGKNAVVSAIPLYIIVDDAYVELDADDGKQDKKEIIFNVRLSRRAEEEVTVKYKTVNGTARADQEDGSKDYESLSEDTLVFKPGETDGKIKITVFGDDNVSHKNLEIFARNTAYRDWDNLEGFDVDKVIIEPEGGEKVEKPFGDLGYRVDKYFNDSITDFQAVGLTSTEEFFLVLSEPTNAVIANSQGDGSEFLTDLEQTFGLVDLTDEQKNKLLEDDAGFYKEIKTDIDTISAKGETWTVAKGTIYDKGKAPVLAVRGTFSIYDAFADLNVNGIGHSQFVNNLDAVTEWLDEVSQPEEEVTFESHITGHSLGGALSQWFAGSYSEQLGEVVTFNSPGIQEQTGVNLESANAKATHYITSADLVSMAGYKFINGEVIRSNYSSFLDPFTFATHSRPILNEVAEGKKNPENLTPSLPLEKEELSIDYLNSWFYTHLPDADYFTLQAVLGSAALLGSTLGLPNPISPIPLSLLGPALTFRGSTELGRFFLGNNLADLVKFALEKSEIITYALAVFEAASGFDVAAWDTIIQEAQNVVGLIELSSEDITTNASNTSDNSSITSALDESLKIVKEKLLDFANDAEFLNKMQVAFGENFNTESAQILRAKWQSGDFSDLDRIEIVPSTEIGGASGAFNVANEKIYIASDFLVVNALNPEKIADILLEEVGHFLDSQVNEVDALGDEGKIFSSIVQGITLTAEQLDGLRKENDIVALALEQPDTFDENVIDNFWKAINFFTEEAWEALAEYPDEAWIAMRSWGETGWNIVSQWTDDEWNASKQLTPAQWEATEEFTENDWNNIFQASTNTPPLPGNDSTTTNEDTTVEIDVLANDTDAENNPLTLSINQAPSNGTATVNDNSTPTNPTDDTITYTPNSNFNGTDSFTYTVTDGTDNTSATVEVNVNPVNDIPIAINDTAETNEDQPLTILPSDLLNNDSDIDGDELKITEVSNSVNGTVELNADGNILFTPDSDFNGLASFEYTVTDGTDTTNATVEITVNPINNDNIINGTTRRDSLIGTDSNDVITGFQGADRITTGNGEDKLVYTSIVDAGDLITDFDPLNDIIDLQGVLQDIGFKGSNAIDDGYVQLVSYGSRGTSLQIDADGTDGNAIFRPYLFLQDVSVAEINDNPNSLSFG